MTQYVIQFEGFDQYLEFVCPVTGPRVTKDIKKAQVFENHEDVKSIRDGLQLRVTSGVTLVIRPVVTTITLLEDTG